MLVFCCKGIHDKEGTNGVPAKMSKTEMACLDHLLCTECKTGRRLSAG